MVSRHQCGRLSGMTATRFPLRCHWSPFRRGEWLLGHGTSSATVFPVSCTRRSAILPKSHTEGHLIICWLPRTRRNIRGIFIHGYRMSPNDALSAGVCFKPYICTIAVSSSPTTACEHDGGYFEKTHTDFFFFFKLYSSFSFLLCVS